MFKLFLPAVFLSSFFAFACSHTPANLLPAATRADSAVIMYYDQVNNPRFFRFVKLYDRSQIEAFGKDANSRVTEVRDECPTDGKIYLYHPKGIVDVLYFSRAESCGTFSFIITGEKYFTNMSPESRKIIDQLASSAKEPVAADDE